MLTVKGPARKGPNEGRITITRGTVRLTINPDNLLISLPRNRKLYTLKIVRQLMGVSLGVFFNDLSLKEVEKLQGYGVMVGNQKSQKSQKRSSRCR